MRSIKTRITLGAVAALTIGIGVTMLLLVTQAERDTLASQRERELHEAARTASVLSTRVVKLQRALSATTSLMDERMLSDPQRLASFIESRIELRSMFSSVFAADAAGRLLVLADSTGIRQPDVSLADRPYFQRTVSEQRPMVSEPVSSRVSARPLIVFTVPVVHAGRTLGVLAGAMLITSRDLLEDLVEDAEEFDSLLVVTDEAGRIIAHPNRARIMESLATEPRMAGGFADWQRGGASLEPTGLLVAQPGQVLAMAAVAGPDWVVWRALPEAELFAPLHQARQQALVWSAAIVAVVSLLSLALISWLLRPLTLLKHRAMHLFDAQHQVDAGWPEADGEIGELSRVLRHVAAERAQLERFNEDLLGKLRSVMDAAPTGIMFTRGDRFELVSKRFCSLFGSAESHYLGQHASAIFAAQEDHATVAAQVAQAFAASTSYMGEWRMAKADGGVFWGRLRGQSVDHGKPTAETIWTLDDITDELAVREELQWSAGHDALTRLPNRKQFEQRVQQIFEALPRSLPAALVMIDLDRFKPINDNAGHAAGDAMLQAVAAAITSHVRSSDLAARLGGDEFALLLQRCPSIAAERIAGKVRQAIADIVLPWHGQLLSVGASLGVSYLTADTPDVASWMAEADGACYAAKAAGRDTVRMACGSGLDTLRARAAADLIAAP